MHVTSDPFVLESLVASMYAETILHLIVLMRMYSVFHLVTC